MPFKELAFDLIDSSSYVARTTLLSLLESLASEGHDERGVCDRVVDLLEAGRVELTGTLRGKRISRRDLEDA
jgi:hypothetical protein